MSKAALDADEVARRCREWYNAEVEPNGRGKIKIIPPDPDQPVIFIGTDFASTGDRESTIARLRRAGMDVHIDPRPKPAATPADVPPKLTVSELRSQHPGADEMADIDQLLGMLAEADKRISKLESARDTHRHELDAHLQLIETQRDEIAAHQTTITQLGKRLEAVEQATGLAVDPNAELDGNILNFLRENPTKHTAQGIAINLDEDTNRVGKRLQSLAHSGQVELVGKIGASNVYRRKV